MATKEQSTFLQQPNIAVLCTVDRRGRAHGAAVWYTYENDEFLISTGVGSQKHKNVEANPEISLVIDKRTPPVYALTARGRAELLPAMTVDVRRRHAARYLPPEQLEMYMQFVATLPSVTIRLRPRKLIEFRSPL
jgi:PPOX class probable F420-dependent enzyme